MDPLTWLAWLMGGATVGLVSVVVGKEIYVYRHRPDPGTFHATPKPEKAYCSACGGRMIKHEGTRGFDRRTGKPDILSFMACPDWDELAWHAKRRANIFEYDEPARECSNRKNVPVAPIYVHKGHADGDVSVACPRCIIDMERAEIISHADADSRLKEIA